MKNHDEVDLHDHTVLEALSTFIKIYNQRIAAGDRTPFTVIHGYGSTGRGGQIRTRLRKYLMKYPEAVRYERGEVLLGNPGVTLVIPQTVLPTQAEGLAGEILRYCEEGKSEGKIIGRFRRFGEMMVKEQLKELERQGLLRSFVKGKFKYYQSLR